MNERLKALRKHLGLTQKEFAEKLNIKRGAIANYEIGRNEPIDAVVSLICDKFNVNEKWLREGTGEMFRKLDKEQELAQLTADLFREEEDSFKYRLITALSRLDEKDWELLEKIAKEINSKGLGLS